MKREFDFQEEEIILIEKATKRKEEEFLKQENIQKAYLLRRDIVQDYFKHMSSANKQKFIKNIVDGTTSIKLVSELLNFMSLGDAKPFIYTSVCHQSDFKYDQFVLDHNRCLNESELQAAIESDMQWFNNLDVDHQMDVIISLIKQSGGYIQKRSFFPLYRKCIRKKESLKNHTEPDIPDRNKITRIDSDDDYFDHPATIEVENRRKNWNQIISRYREKVEGVNKTNKGKREMNEKEKRSTEKSTSDRSRQSAKDVPEGTDWIQLLPVWIVKQIFNYFDQKTLQKLKKVNVYWSFITQEVMKERKLRTQLDKEMEKMKIEIGPTALEEAIKNDPMDGNYKICRRIKNYERGAIVKKLVPQATDGLVKTSLIADVLKGVTEDFFSEKIVSFSREANTDPTLHKHQPCFLRDVNVVLGEQEDVKVQKSFLTYSLSSGSGSLDLTVDRQTIEDW